MPDLFHPNDSDEDTPETPTDPGEFVVALAAEDQMEAQLLISACEEAGIPAILQSPRSGPVGTIASPVDGFNILVPAKDADRAVTLMTERKRMLESDPAGAARAAEEEEAETEQ
jgi:Putative prokaryotic signal transducing protein